MRFLLRDLLPGQDYLMQFRSNDGTNVSPWSQVYRIKTEGDVTAPTDPGNLTWKPTGESFIATWQKPTLDSNGKPLRDFKDYEVTVEANGVSRTYYTVDETFNFTLVMNAEAFGGIELTVKITVKSRDYTLNRSPGVTKTATEDTPPTPSTPTAKSEMGQVSIKWDGKTVLGTVNPLNLSHVEIHASTTDNFTPSSTTVVSRFEGGFTGPQEVVVPLASYGVTYYFKLVAVNRKGKRGNPSSQVSAARARLTGLDITENGLGVNQMNFTARDLGGANAYYGTTFPTGGTYKNGDIFYNTAVPPANNAGKTYRYNGVAWIEDPSIGVISGLKILTNTLTSDAVGTNLLIANKANIADGIIDSAKIGSLDAGKITTGSLQSSSTVTYGGGTARPAWSLSMSGDAQLNSANVRGDLVIGNSGDPAAVRAASMVRSYDYIPNAAGWAIKGDGTVEFNNGTFRGKIQGAVIIGSELKTAEAGRRIQLGSSNQLVGELLFISPEETVAKVRSWTNSSGIDAIQVVYPITGANGVWNGIQIEERQSIYIASAYVDVIVGGEPIAGKTRAFFVRWAPSNTTGSGSTSFPPAGTVNRLVVEETYTALYDGTGRARYYIGPDNSWFYDPAGKGRVCIYRDGDYAVFDAIGNRRLDINSTGYTLIRDQNGQVRLDITSDGGFFLKDQNNFTRFRSDGDTFAAYDSSGGLVLWHDRAQSRWTMNPVDSSSGPFGSFQVRQNDRNASSSPKLTLFDGNNYGGLLKFYRDARGSAMEFRFWADDAFMPVRASNFEVISDVSSKSDIEEFDFDALRAVNSVKVKSYNIVNNSSKSRAKKDGTLTDEIEKKSQKSRTIGLIAQEAPKEIVKGDSNTGMSIDLYSMVSILWSAVQELSSQVAELKSNGGNNE